MAEILASRLRAAAGASDAASMGRELEAAAAAQVRPGDVRGVEELRCALREAIGAVGGDGSNELMAPGLRCAVALCRIISKVARSRSREAAATAACDAAWPFVRSTLVTLDLSKGSAAQRAAVLGALAAMLTEHGAAMPQHEAAPLLAALTTEPADASERGAQDAESLAEEAADRKHRAQAVGSLVPRASGKLGADDLAAATAWAVKALGEAARLVSAGNGPSSTTKSRLGGSSGAHESGEAPPPPLRLAAADATSLLVAAMRAVQMLVQEAPPGCVSDHAQKLAAAAVPLFAFGREQAARTPASAATPGANAKTAGGPGGQAAIGERSGGAGGEGARYVPPHLRRRQQCPPSPARNGTPSRHDAGTSDSDAGCSDSEGGGRSQRHSPESKVRVAAAQLMQAIARADARALHPYWGAVLHVGSSKGTRSARSKGLLGALRTDENARVRRSMASALGAMLDGPSKSYMAAATWRPRRHPGAFTPLSETIGDAVTACHDVLREVVRTEADDGVATAGLKAFAIAAINTDYTRLSPDMLPADLQALSARLNALASMKPRQAVDDMRTAALACATVLAGSKAPKSSAASVELMLAGGSQGGAASSDSLLSSLFAIACNASLSGGQRPEALTALRAVAVHHPRLLYARWGDIRSAQAALVAAGDHKCYALLLRVLGDMLLSLAGSPASVGADGDAVDALSLRARWREVVEEILPEPLATDSSVVRAAALQVLSALTTGALSVLPAGFALGCVRTIANGLGDISNEVIAASARSAGVISCSLPPCECSQGLPLIVSSLLGAIGSSNAASYSAITWALAQVSVRMQGLCGRVQGPRGAGVGCVDAAQALRVEGAPGPSLVGVSVDHMAAGVLAASRERDRSRMHAATCIGNLIGLASPGAAWLDDGLVWLVECAQSSSPKLQAAACGGIESALRWCASAEPRVLEWAAYAVPVLLSLLRSSRNCKTRLGAVCAMVANVDALAAQGQLLESVRAVLDAAVRMEGSESESSSQSSSRAASAEDTALVELRHRPQLRLALEEGARRLALADGEGADARAV